MIHCLYISKRKSVGSRASFKIQTDRMAHYGDGSENDERQSDDSKVPLRDEKESLKVSLEFELDGLFLWCNSRSGITRPAASEFQKRAPSLQPPSQACPPTPYVRSPRIAPDTSTDATSARHVSKMLVVVVPRRTRPLRSLDHG
jgi:hypothetical protein